MRRPAVVRQRRRTLGAELGLAGFPGADESARGLLGGHVVAATAVAVEPAGWMAGHRGDLPQAEPLSRERRGDRRRLGRQQTMQPVHQEPDTAMAKIECADAL